MAKIIKIRCWGNGSPGTVRREGLASRPNGVGTIRFRVESDTGSCSTLVELEPASAVRLADYLLNQVDRLCGSEG